MPPEDKIPKSGSIPVVLALLLVPTLVVWLSFQLAQARGPYWLGTNSDPAYVYLNAGYRIGRLAEPVFFQHPGTPVQIFCAAVTATQGAGLNDLTLTAERDLKAISVAMTLVLAGATLFAGWRARVHGIAVALLIQVLPLTLFTIQKELGRVSPEPIILACVVMVTGVLAGLSDDRAWTQRNAILLGFLVGTAVAAKVTAIPLALGLCCLWRERKTLLLYLGASGLTSLVWVVPHLPKAGLAVRWFQRFLTHEGRYGSGQPALIPSSYLTSLLQVADEQMMILLAAVLGFGLASRRRESLSRLAFSLGLVGLLQILVVARHPYADRYAIPAVVCLLSFPLVLLELKKHRRLPALTLTLVLLAGSGWQIGQEYRGLKSFLVLDAGKQRALAQEAEALRHSGAVVVSSYRASDPAFAHYFGGAYNRFPLSSEVAAAFPNRAILHPMKQQFQRPWRRDRLPLEEFWDGRAPLYLQQGNFEQPELPSGLRLGEVVSGKPPGECLYRLESGPAEDVEPAVGTELD